MTNEERKLRGITDSDICPRCNVHPESIMHVLRDCEGTLELWGRIVDPNVWHLFASLGLGQWLDFNLKTQKMGDSEWNWPIFFASMIQMLWIDRNQFVFLGKSAFPSLFLPKLLGQVEAIHYNLLRRGSTFITASSPIMVG